MKNFTKGTNTTSFARPFYYGIQWWKEEGRQFSRPVCVILIFYTIFLIAVYKILAVDAECPPSSGLRRHVIQDYELQKLNINDTDDCIWVSCIDLQWVPELLEHLDFFHVNKSCKIECCDNKMCQIVHNMILSQGLELKVSLLRRTTISGQHPLF